MPDTPTDEMRERARKLLKHWDKLRKKETTYQVRSNQLEDIAQALTEARREESDK
jgi:uncharacterized protein YabN with tetrapyrrole methylase and pyrophosphatase domain